MKFVFIGVIALIVIFLIIRQIASKGSTHLQLERNVEENIRNNQLLDDPSSVGLIKAINSKDYQRYILANKTSESYLLGMIEEFGEISGNPEYQIHSFGIAEYREWKIIKVDKSVSFFVYHNLVGWFNGYEANSDIPEYAFGYAKNRNDENQDYLFYMNPNDEFGDLQIGAFRNGESFSISLPEAFEEFGNLTIREDISVSMSEQIAFIEENGLNMTSIDSLRFEDHKIKMHE
ncbi:MAG: hypothetical protein AAF487_08715 [Bacteroidota bacterium]